MSTITKRIVCAAMALATVFCLCSCGGLNDDALERVIDSGEFIFGMEDGNSPISWFDEDGNANGIAVEFGQLLASKLGAKAKFVEVPAENSVDALNNNQIDCYLFLGDPGVKLSAQIQSVDTRLDMRHVVIVPVESPVTRLIDLAGKQVGLIPDSPAAAALAQATELSAALGGTAAADSPAALLGLLGDGAVDAVLMEHIDYLHQTVGGRAQVRMIEDQLAGGDYVLAFQREDETMSERCAALMDAAAADGSLSEITRRWLAIDIEA